MLVYKAAKMIYDFFHSGNSEVPSHERYAEIAAQRP